MKQADKQGGFPAQGKKLTEGLPRPHTGPDSCFLTWAPGLRKAGGLRPACEAEKDIFSSIRPQTGPTPSPATSPVSSG